VETATADAPPCLAGAIESTNRPRTYAYPWYARPSPIPSLIANSLS